MTILNLDTDVIDTLLQAREAWLSDLLEPHDMNDYLGWRDTMNLGDRQHYRCASLCKLGLMERDGTSPILYRITTEGKRVAEAIIAYINQPHRGSMFSDEACPLELLYRQFASESAE